MQLSFRAKCFLATFGLQVTMEAGTNFQWLQITNFSFGTKVHQGGRQFELLSQHWLNILFTSRKLRRPKRRGASESNANNLPAG